LTGSGVPYALDVALWLLAGMQLVTVAQRMVAVRRSASGSDAR
jgi:CDP-diacylglycerol--glycerol-3-phosphate 3-phosphatidyltransferase